MRSVLSVAFSDMSPWEDDSGARRPAAVEPWRRVGRRRQRGPAGDAQPDGGHLATDQRWLSGSLAAAARTLRYDALARRAHDNGADAGLWVPGKHRDPDSVSE